MHFDLYVEPLEQFIQYYLPAEVRPFNRHKKMAVDTSLKCRIVSAEETILIDTSLSYCQRI